MVDRPITGDDATGYLRHVADHGLADDTRWLIEEGRFPVGCRVVDASCGSGALVAALAGDSQYARDVIGVELSPELADHALRVAGPVGAKVAHADFLDWQPPAGWRPDIVVMSFYLHHTDAPGAHLGRAAALLPHGSRLYVFDRVALDQGALDSFSVYWEGHYRAAHEWREEMPRLMTAEGLARTAAESGFAFVRRAVCPHDRRAGAERFPKTLVEFWRRERGRRFPAFLLVSPAHRDRVDEITARLEAEGLPVAARVPVPYTDELIGALYGRCPWLEHLRRLVGEVCPERVATALVLDGDHAEPDRIAALGRFKKCRRDEWESVKGPRGADGLRGMILPFHVPEPHEAEDQAHAVGLPPRTWA